MRDGRYACRSKISPDLNVECVAKASYSWYFLAFLSLFIHLRNISDYVFTNKNKLLNPFLQQGMCRSST